MNCCANHALVLGTTFLSSFAAVMSVRAAAAAARRSSSRRLAEEAIAAMARRRRRRRRQSGQAMATAESRRRPDAAPPADEQARRRQSGQAMAAAAPYEEKAAMSPRRIQHLAAVLLAAVVVVAAARDEPAGKNYQTQWDTVMSILNCKSDSLIPSYICSVISKSRWGWGSDDPADDYTPAAAARPLRSTADLPKYVDALPQMPKILGYGIGPFGFPVPINLTIGMYHTTWQFHRNMTPTPVFVYGQSLQTATFPGPTIVARHNVPLYVTWENHLPDAHILPSLDRTIDVAIPKNGGVPTVVHLHGAAQAPDSDGHALAWFTRDFAEKGSTWTKKTYTYPNVQPAAGNIWYHDHALGLTRASLLAGLLAAYIVEWPELEMPFNLPSGEFDLHLVIADRQFNANGTIYMNSTGVVPSVHPQWNPEYFGEVITVNGKAWPYLRVQRRRYRLRILNASNARYLNIRFSNGLPFTVIASDASYLSAPVTVSNLLLSPAEIFDVIVDFSLAPEATEIEMLNSAPYPYPTGNATNPDLDGKVMKFLLAPKGQLDDMPLPDNSTVPEHRVGVPYASVTALPPPLKTRYIVLYENMTKPDNLTMNLYINGLRLEDPPTETPRSGTTELWHVINLTPDNHPLHLHLAEFQAVKMQQLVDPDTFTSCMKQHNDTVICNLDQHAVGALLPVPEEEKTWKNVVKLPPAYVTSVVVAFRLVHNNMPYPFDATAAPGYVYHCHSIQTKNAISNGGPRRAHLVGLLLCRVWADGPLKSSGTAKPFHNGPQVHRLHGIEMAIGPYLALSPLLPHSEQYVPSSWALKQSNGPLEPM
uniref:Plastocyanin-like domain-containing protein n=1 Tax=Oryza nivara TaxID=4536 RepID=A0A0E0FFN7_ORYNI